MELVITVLTNLDLVGASLWDIIVAYVYDTV